MQILVYCKAVNHRIEFTLNLVLKQLCNLETEIITSAALFLDHQGPKISYSETSMGGAPFIVPAGLLFENDIVPQNTELFDYEGFPAFFGTAGENTILPFDIFASSFYLVTRYEEYLPFHADRFGRYPAEESLASKGKFLHLPLVNIWAQMLREKLKLFYPNITFGEREFTVRSTIDIDHAYAYLLRPPHRVAGGYLRSLKRLKIGEIFQRTAVLLRLAKDPYDNYNFILHVHRKYGLRALFFILFADYGGNDNNVSLRRKKFRHLIRHLAHHANIGIHPSLSSAKKFSRLENELSGLVRVTGKEIKYSRQHFLKVILPKTYRTLISIGISDDFSMGYASRPGFRASIAEPFPFFDLTKNEITTLTIHPVVLMDVTLRDYLRLNLDEAREMSFRIIDEIIKVKGEFVLLWHNESLSGHGKWKGWRQLYEEILKYSLKNR